jgi:hypothetical protein
MLPIPFLSKKYQRKGFPITKRLNIIKTKGQCFINTALFQLTESDYFAFAKRASTALQLTTFQKAAM